MARVWIFSVALCTACQILSARPLPAPVSIPSYRGNFLVSSDALYFRTSYPDLNFAIVDDRSDSPSLPIGRQKCLAPHSKWGFRVAAGYGACGMGNDITGRYLWYKATQTKQATAPTLWLTVGIPGEPPFLPDGNARARLRIRHQTGDLEFGQLLHVGAALNLRLFAGIHYAWIDHKFDIDYSNIEFWIASRRNGEFFGFGPRLGCYGSCCLGYGFYVEGWGGGSLLAGGERNRFSVLENSQFVADVRDPMKVRFVPFLEGALGLAWQCNQGGIGWTVRLGYELMNYIHGISRLQFLGDSSAINTHSCSNFGLHGVYIGCTACY